MSFGMRSPAERCPACAEPALVPWRKATAVDRRATERQYRLWRCRACGTAVTASRSATDAQGLYTGGVYARPPHLIDQLLEPARRFAAGTALSFASGLRRGASVHEVGAGDGALLRAFAARGYRVSGSDPFASADGSSGRRVARIAAEEESLSHASVDLVLYWHVLEHLDEPEVALRRLAPAVHPGGRVVVAVPNTESLQARVGGDRWFHQDVPRHQVHFTRRGLVRLLDRCGFRIIRIRTFSLDQNLLGFVQTLLNFLTRERNVLFRAMKRDLCDSERRDLLVSLAAVAPATVLALLLESAAVFAGRGGSLIILAEPEVAA